MAIQNFFLIAKTANVFYFEPKYPDGDKNFETASYIKFRIDNIPHMPFWTDEQLIDEFIEKNKAQLGNEKVLFNTVQNIFRILPVDTPIIFNPYSNMTVRMSTASIKNVI